MPRGQLITVDDEVFEVVDEAPGRTSMFLVNRSRKYAAQVEALEQQLASIRAALNGVKAQASREQRTHGRRRTDNQTTSRRA